MDSEACLLLGVKLFCLLGMVGVGLEREPCLLSEDFRACSGIAGRAEGLKNVGAEEVLTSDGLKKVGGASDCSVAN